MQRFPLYEATIGGQAHASTTGKNRQRNDRVVYLPSCLNIRPAPSSYPVEFVSDDTIELCQRWSISDVTSDRMRCRILPML